MVTIVSSMDSRKDETWRVVSNSPRSMVRPLTASWKMTANAETVRASWMTRTPVQILEAAQPSGLGHQRSAALVLMLRTSAAPAPCSQVTCLLTPSCAWTKQHARAQKHACRRAASCRTDRRSNSPSRWSCRVRRGTPRCTRLRCAALPQLTGYLAAPGFAYAMQLTHCL